MKERVLATAKALLQKGLVEGTSGNVSGRMEDGTICVTPSSIAYETMTLDDLVVLDLDGGGTDALDRVAALGGRGQIAGKVIAFVSHVDDGLRRAAADAGIQAVPRGKFWRSLGKILNEE